MREFSVFLLAFSSLVPIILVYKDRDRIYQLPFLYSMALIVYVLPTLFGVLGNKAILKDEAYIRYILFSTLCFWVALLGYWSTYNHPQLRPRKVSVHDPDKWSRFLYVIMFIAFIAIVYLGGFDASDRNGGAYAVLLYPARCLRPATIMLLILYLVKPSRKKLVFLIISLLFSLKIILIDGRRSEVFNLFITIAFPLFFIKGVRAPRSLIAPAIVGALIVFTLLPAYRNFTLKGDFQGITNISPGELLQSYIAGGSTNEVIEAARNMDVADKGDKYNYGSTLYNTFVMQYAATNFFGKEFKASLLIAPNLDLDKLRAKNSLSDDDQYHNYLAPTGFAAVFFEFGYFGCILFFIFGSITKRFYVQADIKNDLSAIMFYCFFSTFILSSIYSSMLYIPTDIVLYMVVFWGAKKYSKVRGSGYLVRQI